MRVRRTILLLVVLALAAVLPASAFAQAPLNDVIGGAEMLTPAYFPANYPVIIPPTSWTDAGSTEDMTSNPPTCLGSTGFHSMWYSIPVLEASVLTIQLKSSAVDRYQPVVTITDPSNNEVACGLGGSDSKTDPGALASAYVPKGTYYIRVASVQNSVTGSNIELPSITLTESLRDVTPPQIQVSVSGKAKIIGVDKTYTFDASASTDKGSGLDLSSAGWQFYENGQLDTESQTLMATHAWKTPGLHRVSLTLADKNGNKNTYSFNVLVHNFVPPKVSMTVYVPAPGSRQIHIVLKHDVPIRVRLVVMQGSTVLRAIPSRLVKVSGRKSSLKLALRKKVGKSDFVVVSGVASDVGQFPNTVPLLTCSVDPVHGGGKCA